MISCKTYSRTK